MTAAKPQALENELTKELSLLLESDRKNEFAAHRLRRRVEQSIQNNNSYVGLYIVSMGLDVLQGRHSNLYNDWEEIKQLHNRNINKIDPIDFLNASYFATLGGEASLSVLILREAMQIWPLDYDILFNSAQRFHGFGMAHEALELFKECAVQASNEKLTKELQQEEIFAQAFDQANVSDEECFILTSALYKSIAQHGFDTSELHWQISLREQEESYNIYMVFSAKWMTHEIAILIWETYNEKLANLLNFPYEVLDKISIDVDDFNSGISLFKSSL